MCKRMQLHQDAAVIGYKLSADRIKDPVQQLSTAEDYKSAVGAILRKIRGARTKEHKLILYNLVRVLLVSPAQASLSMMVDI